MRFHDELLERFRRIVAARRIALEQLPCRQQHLVGGLAAPALASHAVGQHTQQAARRALVGDDFDLVLLVGPISPMDACRGRQSVAEGRCTHGRKL